MAGEGYRRINLVLDGKVAWHYDTEDSWEVGEFRVLSNGNTVITTRFCQAYLPQAIEVTPDKRAVGILQDLKYLGDGESGSRKRTGFPIRREALGR